jgi:cytochrome P450
MYKQSSDAASVVQSSYDHLETQEDITSVHRKFGEMFTFSDEQTADRREHPRGDALSVVVNPPADSDLPRLNAVELVGVAQSLLTAGNETMTLLLGNLMFRLVTNPQERERLIADPSGAHTCLGAPLARLEGRVVAEAVLARLGNPRLDGDDAALRLSSVIHRGFKELRIRFDPSPLGDVVQPPADRLSGTQGPRTR